MLILNASPKTPASNPTIPARAARTEAEHRSECERQVIPLEILIGGLAYGVEPATDERDGTQYGWYVESACREEVYEVVPLPGVMTCTCNHFKYRLRGTGKQCKHLKAVREQLPAVCKRPRPAAEPVSC